MSPVRSLLRAPPSFLARASNRLFRHIAIDDAWRQCVESVAARGPVVYVLRNVSALDYLALNHLTHRLDLPRIGFANELAPALRPQGPLRHEAPAALLRETIMAGGSAALFVKRAPHTGIGKSIASGLGTSTSAAGRGRSEGDALLLTLLELQRSKPEQEIMMMPQTFVWSLRPEQRGFSLVDTLFGPADFPGELRMAAMAMVNHKNCRLRAGEPLSLRQFLAEQGGDSPSAIVRRLTYMLLRRVERERRTIVGPARKAPDRVREEVLRSPKLQHIIRELAGPGSQERARLTDKARGMLRELQTAPDPETQQSLELLVDRVFERLYRAIDVDTEGIDRLREAARDGSVVLLPSHKSHVDYVVLSYVLRKHGIQTPVIAAGDNLAFFPLGPLLRRAGAFFIRRNFRGDRLYTAVVDAYIRRLLREGWLIEFFLEGGRSRTGKLLPPMLGLLNMLVAAALRLDNRRVHFVPVSIGYERLMEEGAFERELSGVPKRSEDLLGLLKASGVLVDRWGRINIQFGEILELSALRRQLGYEPTHDARPREDPIKPARRRAIVKNLAHRVMAEINRVTAVTPGALVALVLLGHGKRGIAYRDLLCLSRGLTTLLLDSGARATPSLSAEGRELRERGVREALRLYVKGGLIDQHVPGDTLTGEGRKRAALYSGNDVIFRVPDSKRLRLDFAKNTIIHFVVDRCLISLALLNAPEEPSEDQLRSRVRNLSRLFKFEFMFRADASYDELFDGALDEMRARGELVNNGDRLAAGPGFGELDGKTWLSLHAAGLRNFVEAYLVAARALRLLLKGPVQEKELIARALRSGERMFLQGEIERSESVCGPLVRNAYRAFTELGYVLRQKDEIELTESFATEDGIRTIEARLTAYLSH